MAALPLGTLVPLYEDPAAGFAAVRAFGLECCQVVCWQPASRTPELAARVQALAREHGIAIDSFWAGHSGPAVWDFSNGPATIGLVPAATRAARVAEYVEAAAFAEAIGAPSVTTHVGFIPEDPNDANYRPTVAALRTIAQACRARGLGLWFESGQETPVTLLRAIVDIGLDNVGINLDPANLILYGKGNPVDALSVFGPLVRGVHAKDGRYPTSPMALGEETPIGEGAVDFKALFAGLRRQGYAGRVVIEREISGDQQRRDIADAVRYLRPLLST
jgi:L-ribulose-5-phosphate 3-epimerase